MCTIYTYSYESIFTNIPYLLSLRPPNSSLSLLLSSFVTLNVSNTGALFCSVISASALHSIIPYKVRAASSLVYRTYKYFS